MSDPYDLAAEEAFIASSFVDFHTEEPASPGDWIPMTEEEASGRWESWLAEHDRQVAERTRREVLNALPLPDEDARSGMIHARALIAAHIIERGASDE